LIQSPTSITGSVPQPVRRACVGNALRLHKIKKIERRSIDLVVTSPPYWQKRDYRHVDQLGQEPTAQAYAKSIVDGLEHWFEYLSPSGSVFLNIGDTYRNRALQGVPGRIETLAVDRGFKIRNRIIWHKQGGRPEPAQSRLSSRHEYILHFIQDANYYYDLFGYATVYSDGQRGANPGDVWNIVQTRNMSRHLAPFPQEVAERAILLACPEQVCTKCNVPRRRIVERTLRDLDLDRPQARRAIALAEEAGLSDDHLAAIQATGISDAGKALLIQNGTGRNSEKVKKLAKEAKQALGGYFREFIFAKRRSAGWTDCECGAPFRAGTVLDPFVGTGTTLDAAEKHGRSGIGVDLDASMVKLAKRCTSC